MILNCAIYKKKKNGDLNVYAICFAININLIDYIFYSNFHVQVYLHAYLDYS